MLGHFKKTLIESPSDLFYNWTQYSSSSKSLRGSVPVVIRSEMEQLHVSSVVHRRSVFSLLFFFYFFSSSFTVSPYLFCVCVFSLLHLSVIAFPRSFNILPLLSSYNSYFFHHPVACSWFISFISYGTEYPPLQQDCVSWPRTLHHALPPGEIKSRLHSSL